MNLEEPNQICSNSSNGGDGICKSLKKQKQKKIPQRGLGVAQLERIRIEELQKKDCANSVLTSPPIISPANSPSLPLPLLNYPSTQSSSSTPFPSLSSNFVTSSQNPILRQPPPPIPTIDNFYLNSVPQFNHSNGRADAGWPSVPKVNDRAHLHKIWHPYELNRDGENSVWDRGLLLPPNMSLPFEGCPIMPLPDIMSKTPQFSQASASMLMNMPLANSSSIWNLQMEPPSNQSLYSNLSSLWREEEKMPSAKRPYPFHFDTPPIPSFHNKQPRIASRSDESTSFGSGSLFNPDHDVLTLREAHLLPSSNPVEHCSKNFIKETRNQNGDFLSLLPPSPRWRHSLSHRTDENPIANSPRSTSLNHRIPEKLPVSNSRAGSATVNHRNHDQPFFSFFPILKVQQETSTMNIHCNSKEHGEVGGIMDLNLKL